MFKKIVERKGAALLMVLMVMLALSIIGTVVLSLSVGETKQVVVQERYLKSHFAARAGADAMATYYMNRPNELLAYISGGAKLGAGSIGDRDFATRIEPLVYNDDGLLTEFKIHSTGGSGIVKYRKNGRTSTQ